MFVNRHTHIVSETIEKTALINLATAGLCGAARMIINRHGSASPDMLNQLTWNIQTAASLLQVVLTGMVFFRAYRTLARCRKLIPREDYYEMAKLQEEVLPDFGAVELFHAPAPGGLGRDPSRREDCL